MKIYTQDHSWAGCIVVVAESEEVARMKMAEYLNYAIDVEVEEHEIEEFSFANYGDL